MVGNLRESSPNGLTSVYFRLVKFVFSICIYLNVCAGRRSCGVYMHIHFLHTRIHIHLQTHPHIHTYIYMCVCVCLYACDFVRHKNLRCLCEYKLYIYILHKYMPIYLSIYLSIYIYIYEAMPAVRGGRGSHRALQELSQQLGFSWLGGVELGSVARNWLIDGD